MKHEEHTCPMCEGKGTIPEDKYKNWSMIIFRTEEGKVVCPHCCGYKKIVKLADNGR